MRTASIRMIIATTTSCCISVVVFAEPIPPKTLDEVFAPVVVGTPPVNAFNGLFRCPDGEMSHYGDDGFLYSRDNGLTWKHRHFGDVDASGKAAGGGRPLGMSPKTGACLRMYDGRVLLFWCNTTPLPEVDRTNDPIPESAKNGRWEDVFTNRDACHAAISEDDGGTWIGFREMRLNPRQPTPLELHPRPNWTR